MNGEPFFIFFCPQYCVYTRYARIHKSAASLRRPRLIMVASSLPSLHICLRSGNCRGKRSRRNRSERGRIERRRSQLKPQRIQRTRSRQSAPRDGRVHAGTAHVGAPHQLRGAPGHLSVNQGSGKVLQLVGEGMRLGMYTYITYTHRYWQ